MKTTIILLGAALLILAVLWIFGPRAVITNPPSELPEITTSVDDYLANQESQVEGLKEGVQKGVIWAHPDEKKTEYAVIYLHGFSSSRKEISPVTEDFAKEIDANVFFQRFSGSGGKSGEAMGDVELTDWMEDALEAVAIGKMIGEKLIIVGTSHGGLLSMWLASLDAVEPHALILVSPNMGPQDARTKLLALPWAQTWMPLLTSSHRSWEAQNSGHEFYWNTRYPSKAVFPLMAQVNYIAPRAPQAIKCPTLVFYSTKDQTVRPELIEKAFADFPSTNKKLVLIENSGDAKHHVLAGDILSPQTTQVLIDEILNFFESI